MHAALRGVLAVCMVVLDVVVQERGLPEGLQTARGLALEGVVVQFNGEDWGRLVFDDSIQWLSAVLVGGRQMDLAFQY